MTPEKHAAVQYGEGYIYRTNIEGSMLKYRSVDSEGAVRDEFVIEK